MDNNWQLAFIAHTICILLTYSVFIETIYLNFGGGGPISQDLNFSKDTKLFIIKTTA